MSFNLLDAAKGLLTNETIQQASSFLGESEGSTHKAISGILPVILSGLVNKSSTSHGANEIAAMSAEQHHAGLLDNIGNFFGSDNTDLLNKGTNILGSIFGDKSKGITSLISNFSGIKSSSSGSLLGMAAPLILGFLGKHAVENNMNAGGLASLLSSQKDTISNAIPSGLNLSSVLGSAGGEVKHAAAAAVRRTQEMDEDSKSGGMKLLLPLLLLILLAAGAYYLFGTGGNKNKESNTHAVEVTTPEPTPAIVAAAEPMRESLKVKLINGVEIDAYKGGIEDKLVAFLATNYKALGADSLKNIWFDFDNLNFKTASADLTAESQKQVDNMTAILKAYPAVKLKIGGYTDKVGDEAMNKKLSGDRAKSVQAALAKAGVGGQITDAEGYGSAFAKFAATASESERVLDRHVSVSVR